MLQRRSSGSAREGTDSGFTPKPFGIGALDLASIHDVVRAAFWFSLRSSNQRVLVMFTKAMMLGRPTMT